MKCVLTVLVYIAQLALEAGKIVVFCIGETLEEREADHVRGAMCKWRLIRFCLTVCVI